MRNHAIQCINMGKMEKFPSEMEGALPAVDKIKLKLYCKCKMPDWEGQENMAYCPMCREWYHKSCEEIPDIVFANRKQKYICSKCCNSITA